ncbi:MAG TPA: DUF2069 domain-containing protein [Burkholderiales bacterium]|nr:DUF2069 domain-containing protein [Burkholderiales bacterium]
MQARLSAPVLHRIAAALLVALVALCIAWELWLAPLRPGGSWLALKVLPLAPALPGVLKGRLYTFRWAMMLVLVYFIEGTVRAWSERGTSATLAIVEIVLALGFYATAIAYVRVSRRAPQT